MVKSETKPQQLSYSVRPRERRHVTIAAGYVCDSGVVLCADTQETIPGYTKTDAKKLLAFSCTGFDLIFAGAGNNATQIDETAYEIAAHLKDIVPKTSAEFRDSLREVLEKLFPKAHYPKPSGPEVDLLMAIKKKDNAELLRISDCSVAPIPQRVAVGSGVILALQLLQRHYDNSAQINEAAIICIYVLHHVKRWVDGCGGNTEVALIPKDGDTWIFMPSDKVTTIEAYAEAYDDALKGLLLAVPRTPKSLVLFNEYVKEAKDKLEFARMNFQDMEDTMRELSERLGIDYDQAMRDAADHLTSMQKCLCLSRQIFKSERIGGNHVAQRINEQGFGVPTIEPELHFLKVGFKMLSRKTMPRTDDAALQQTEGAFDGVRVDIAVHVDLRLMPDGLVALRESNLLHRGRIGLIFIGHDHIYVFAYVVLDVLSERAALYVVGMKESNISAALPKSDHDLLCALAVPSLVLMAVLDSADECFIHFNRAIEHRLFRRCHCGTNTMAEIPCRLVTALVLPPERPLELRRAHALLGFADQQYSQKPHRQWKMGIVKDRATHHRELVRAHRALEPRVILHPRNAMILATRARHPFGPAQPLKQFAALFIGRKHRVNFRERHG
jgi:20S proteasome alpha/beta subunit